MLVLRLLVMVLTIICLMDGHAEVLSSTTAMRNGGEISSLKQNEPEVQILDRKKKKKPKPGKKKKPKPNKKKKPKPNKAKPTPTKPVTTTPTISTSTLKTTTITTTAKTTTTTVSPTTTATTAKTTTSTASATTTLSTTTSATTTAKTTSTATTTITTISTTATTSSPATTTATTADSGAGGECKATNGKPCIFPFKDGNEEYNECKNEGGKYFWCATSVYDSGKYKHWSYCPNDGSCPIPGDGECRATNNKPCVFPFKDGNKEYNECADQGGKYFWCATGTNSAGMYTAWSECPKDGSCPLPPKSTPPGATSTLTIATTTLPNTASSMPATTISPQESASTTVLVKDGEKIFSCQMDFTFESTAGFKMNSNFSSSCSPSSSATKHYKNFDEYAFDITTSSGAEINCKINIVIQDETSGISMATKPIEKSLECSVDESKCVTISGEHFPTSCVVPFIHEGRKYQACTDKGGKDAGKLWCATAVDENEEMTKWGYCSTACGYCGGKDVTDQDTRAGGACGYDCFINPYKPMEPKTQGIDPKLLSAPGVSYYEDEMTMWNKLPNIQFQFLQGQPGIFLNCLDGFNHFPCHQSIYIKCDGNYRFSIYAAELKDDKTATIGEFIQNDVKNVQIGCGPCPMGFIYKVGDEVSTYLTSWGKYDGIPDIGVCRDLCNNRDCPTFVYSLEDKYCELHSVRVERPSNPGFKDYRLCTREEENSCGPTTENCGRMSNIDLEHLIAEQNGPFIFKIIDNTKDSTESYRTKIFPVFLSDNNGYFQFMMDANAVPNTGLFSLFLAPSSSNCDENSLENAIISESEYYSIAIEDSLSKLEGIAKDIPSLVNEIKNYYNGKTPSVCGTVTYMRTEVAESRLSALKEIFNFLLNSGKKYRHFLPDNSNICKSFTETVNSIRSCKMFDNDSQINFKSQEAIVQETDGFLKTTLVRNLFDKKGIAFIKTVPSAADLSDFVGYEGPVVFLAGSSAASVYISVKLDTKIENDEHFSIKLLKYSNSDKQTRDEKSEILTLITEDKNRQCHPTNNKCKNQAHPHCWRSSDDDKVGVCVCFCKDKDYSTQCTEKTKGCQKCFRNINCVDSWKLFCNKEKGFCDICNDQSCKALKPPKVCKETVGCVDCMEDLHCNNEKLSKCDKTSNTCIPCQDTANCGHLNLGNSVKCLKGVCKKAPYVESQLTYNGNWMEDKNQLAQIYTLTGTQPLYYDKNNDKSRCVLDKISSSKKQKHENTLNSYNNWNDGKLGTKLAKSAYRIIERLLTEYPGPGTESYKQQVLAVAKVRKESDPSAANPEIYIAGNLQNKLINRVNPANKPYKITLISQDILSILDYEEVEYKEVYALKHDKQTQRDLRSKWSHEHAEMQIIKFIKDYNNNIKLPQGEKKVIMAFGINKPPCCACNTVLDKTLNAQYWKNYETTDTNGQITSLPFIELTAEAYSLAGTDKCLDNKQKKNTFCGSQYHTYDKSNSVHNKFPYWTYPGKEPGQNGEDKFGVVGSLKLFPTTDPGK